MIAIGTAIKNIKKYTINAAYSLLTFPAALFLISAYLAHMIHYSYLLRDQKYLKYNGGIEHIYTKKKV
jgi:hypothetical protein